MKLWTTDDAWFALAPRERFTGVGGEPRGEERVRQAREDGSRAVAAFHPFGIG